MCFRIKTKLIGLMNPTYNAKDIISVKANINQSTLAKNMNGGINIASLIKFNISFCGTVNFICALCSFSLRCSEFRLDNSGISLLEK